MFRAILRLDWVNEINVENIGNVCSLAFVTCGFF
jgi:hypothetical protein